ncbi:MAG: DEAD/DEAH box helicase, partial [Candidatus Dormibacteria bacterium]
MAAAGLIEGQTVRVRGARSIISRIVPSTVDPDIARVDLRVLGGETAGTAYSVFIPIDEVVPEAVPELDLARIGPFRNWQAFHDAFRFELAAPPDRLVASPEARVAIDPYQRVPAERLLALPRPRLLIADDVGLGKTIEAGLAYLELAARRRARRVLIVAPASICEQWREELLDKFGIEFEVFDRERIDYWRRSFEIGANPWQLRPRVIVSLDLAKLETTFPELSRSEWDLAVVDEAHHVTDDEGEQTLNRRFAEWLAHSAAGLLLLSATPHNGSDESFASLLRLLEPRIAPAGTGLVPSRFEPYVVRRLKGDVCAADGSPRFVPREAVRPIPVELD